MFSLLFSPIGILVLGGILLFGTLCVQFESRTSKRCKRPATQVVTDTQNAARQAQRTQNEQEYERDYQNLLNQMTEQEERLRSLVNRATQAGDQLRRMIGHFDNTFFGQDQKNPSVQMVFQDLRSDLQKEITQLEQSVVQNVQPYTFSNTGSLNQ